MIAALFGVVVVVMLLSVPIGVSLIVAVLLYISLTGNVSFYPMVITKMFTAVDNFSLLAMPCFIFAGNVMADGGISARLVRFVKILLGWTPASLANITVGASAFFGAISGSNAATCAAIGGITIPEMKNNGYPDDVAAAVAAAGSTLGCVVPPSVNMITYAITASVSVTTMFTAGFMPALIMAISMIVVNVIFLKKYEVRDVKLPSAKVVWAAFKEAIWALLMPVIILGGIYGGICTPTEAGAVSCLYGVVVSLFIYKEIKFRDLAPILINSAITSAAILFVMAAATPFQWIMSSSGMSQTIANFVLNTVDSRIVILLLINIVLLFLGCFLETTAIILLMTPVLLPIAISIGLDPIVLGIITIVNTSIGMITPPMAVCLFVASGISGCRIEAISKRIIPFLIAEIVALLIITYWPDIILVLPRLSGYTG